MLEILCVLDSAEALSEILKLRNLGCDLTLSYSNDITTRSLHSEVDFKLVIIVNGAGTKDTAIKHIEYVRQSRWGYGPIIFLSPEARETFNFNFNKSKIEFIQTPVATRNVVEAIARIAYE